MNKGIVIKVGGSILYNNDLEVNVRFIKQLKEWYNSSVKEYSKIVLVVGGGKLSRFIQGKVHENVEEDDHLHQVGMSVTQVNASVLCGCLGDTDIYIPRGLGDAYEYLKNEERVRMVSGGLKVGWSTDLDAAVFADALNIDRVFKISDIDFLYSSNPKENPEAQPLKDVSWEEYFKIFGITKDSKHTPNSHIPIDSQCAQFADKKGIGIHISGGKKLEENTKLEELFQGGSYIHP